MIETYYGMPRAFQKIKEERTMRKVLALLLSLVMTLTLLVPATWAEEKTATGYQLPASLKGKTVILHTNDVHGAIDK